MFDALSRYFEFHGRSSRSDLWMSLLLYMIMYVVAIVIDFGIFGGTSFEAYGVSGPVSSIVVLAHIVPFLSIYTRRLHDTGNSAWMLLLLLVPIVNLYVCYLVLFAGSQTGTNKFGPPHVANPQLAATPPNLSGAATPPAHPKSEADGLPPVAPRSDAALAASSSESASGAVAPAPPPLPLKAAAAPAKLAPDPEHATQLPPQSDPAPATPRAGQESGPIAPSPPPLPLRATAPPTKLAPNPEPAPPFPRQSHSAPGAPQAALGSGPIAPTPPPLPLPTAARSAELAPNPERNAGPPIAGDAVEAMLQKLGQLGRLRDQGVLNEAEFTAQKERILRESSASS